MQPGSVSDAGSIPIRRRIQHSPVHFCARRNYLIVLLPSSFPPHTTYAPSHNRGLTQLDFRSSTKRTTTPYLRAKWYTRVGAGSSCKFKDEGRAMRGSRGWGVLWRLRKRKRNLWVTIAHSEFGRAGEWRNDFSWDIGRVKWCLAGRIEVSVHAHLFYTHPDSAPAVSSPSPSNTHASLSPTLACMISQVERNGHVVRGWLSRVYSQSRRPRRTTIQQGKGRAEPERHGIGCEIR